MRSGPIVIFAAVCTATVLVATAITGGSIDEDDDKGPGGDLSLNVQEIPEEYRDWIIQAGKSCKAHPTVVTPALIAAQIEAESGWNPNARSPVGAIGLSQFMPPTWATWGVDADKSGSADPLSPPDAIMSQARYDCWLATKVSSYKIANGDIRRLMLAGYNAGPDAVRIYQGVPPYAETQQYVARILQLIAKYSVATDESAGPFGSRVIAHAQRWTGTPYSWGGGGINGPSFGFAQGATTNGFDCSSLVQYAVYHASGGKITLARTSQQQVTQGKAVARQDLRPGDIIGFQLNGAGYDHVAIYIGDGQILHAPRTGQTVSTARLTDGYYASKPQIIRRYG
ncbi:NlpC/P60 family protein [Streptomyces sp. Wb2n-11]|uniref:bifunctional lytic transglycosylase/C40 family peptidase n=1 Tax=Streptomyces sp. Wb2n-11 TaxID=1030533 RepID=UPI000A48D1EC|nr:NlpC/P60 family protein [Streptomyces sp. Wb2n-11]